VQGAEEKVHSGLRGGDALGRRDEATGKWIGPMRAGLHWRDDPLLAEIAVRVVVDRHDFIRRAGGALEVGIARLRPFAAAIAGADALVALGHRSRRLRSRRRRVAGGTALALAARELVGTAVPALLEQRHA